MSEREAAGEGGNPAPPRAEVLRALARFGTATLHAAAGRIGALPTAIKPVHTGMRVCGPAVPVQSPPGDNLWIHRAIYTARPGDVLVVSTGGAFEYGYWGEIMSLTATTAKRGGLVIDTCVRDHSDLGEIGSPVFARGLCIRGTGKDLGAIGSTDTPILIGDVVINDGDAVVGDADGGVVVPAERVLEIAAAAQAREAREKDILGRLRAGARTLDIYGLG